VYFSGGVTVDFAEADACLYSQYINSSPVWLSPLSNDNSVSDFIGFSFAVIRLSRASKLRNPKMISQIYLRHEAFWNDFNPTVCEYLTIP